MLFGLHAVSAAWLNEKRRVLRLLIAAQAQKAFTPIREDAHKKNIRRPVPEMVDARAIEKLLPPAAVHQGIVAEVEPLPELALEDLLEAPHAHGCFVVLDQVTDPHNVGAILRSACAFGARALLVTERHASATTGTLAKAASGALEHTPIVRIGNMAQALEKMQKGGYWCIGLDETGRQALHEIKMPPKVALVMGAEGDGLRRLTMEKCDEIAKLPTQPPVGSLNVSNAAAVAIYEVMRAHAGLRASTG